MRTLEKHAYILRFVVAYRCSDCGQVFKVPVKSQVTGGISGPPREVLENFSSHHCEGAAPAVDAPEQKATSSS